MPEIKDVFFFFIIYLLSYLFRRFRFVVSGFSIYTRITWKTKDFGEPHVEPVKITRSIDTCNFTWTSLVHD